MNMIGVCRGRPRNRRFELRKVAIAAMAVSFVFAAATAQAGIAEMRMDEDASSLSYAGSSIFIPAV